MGKTRNLVIGTAILLVTLLFYLGTALSPEPGLAAVPTEPPTLYAEFDANRDSGGRQEGDARAERGRESIAPAGTAHLTELTAPGAPQNDPTTAPAQGHLRDTLPSTFDAPRSHTTP